MANPLAALLSMGQQGLSETVDPNQIVVPGSVNRPAEIDPLLQGPQNVNTEPLPQNVLTPEQLRDMQPLGNIPERTGMFGTRGTLRDILGLVGDAFLVQGGRDRIYAPRREQERLADAMAGFTQNEIEAIQRVAVDNPELAWAMYQQNQNQVREDRTQDFEVDKQERLLSNDRFDRINEVRDLAARYMAAASEQNSDYIMGLIAQAANNADVSLEELGISPNMTIEQMQAYSAGDMSVNQQRQIPFTERRVTTGEYNAETGRINATRPRAQPAPRNATEATELERIRGRLNRGEALSPGDQATWDRYINGTRTSRGGRNVPQYTGSTLPPNVSVRRVN